MKSTAAILFCCFSLFIAHFVAKPAIATVNEQQERLADIICDVDPKQCGLK